MQKTILITGATDGIGLETAKMLVSQGHRVLIHGRNPNKLDKVTQILSAQADSPLEGYIADLSRLEDAAAMAQQITEKHKTLDALINNAGVFKTSRPTTPDGLDVRFLVNTVAPYLLTKRLMPLLGQTGRVVNLSSAAQAAVDPTAFVGRRSLSDMEAYAQSKCAITMWSRSVALANPDGPIIVAVNPGSLLASKMVKEGFGVVGGDLGIGANILVRAALDPSFADASGKYFDNDAGRFSSPNPDAMDPQKAAEITRIMEDMLSKI